MSYVPIVSDATLWIALAVAITGFCVVDWLLRRAWRVD